MRSVAKQSRITIIALLALAAGLGSASRVEANHFVYQNGSYYWFMWTSAPTAPPAEQLGHYVITICELGLYPTVVAEGRNRLFGLV